MLLLCQGFAILDVIGRIMKDWQKLSKKSYDALKIKLVMLSPCDGLDSRMVSGVLANRTRGAGATI